MSQSEFKQGSVICGAGDSLHHLLFILKGSVDASFNEHPFCLEKGDMIGICDLSTGSHSCTYTATSDVTVISYPCENFSALEALVRGNADIANLVVTSMCRQLSAFLQYRFTLKQESGRAYEVAQEIYPQYQRLCAQYAVSPKELAGLSELVPFLEEDPLEDWLHEYYMGIHVLDTATHNGFFYNKPGISIGFLRKGAMDSEQILQSCWMYQEYSGEMYSVFLNDNEYDLFKLISDLRLGSADIQGAGAAVEPLMARLTGLLSNMTGIDPDYYRRRLASYKRELSVKRGGQETEDAPAGAEGTPDLTDSLDIIMDYSGCHKEICAKFTRLVREYTELSDSGASDDNERILRKELTALFHTIYQQVFLKSCNDPVPPTVIRMFLNFGYVDAALAGTENADYLYSIAETTKGDPELGVYTLCEWLTAIYKGQKEPSRNEFDLDYAESLREMKKEGRIDAKEEARLLADNEAKLLFEIENVFPIANKITFGRISTYCPLFSSHNVLRKLEVSRITPERLTEVYDDIRGIDFYAFSREVLYSNPACEITNEVTHVVILPDVILFPNVGARGSLWQEIEGKKRETPARMFMPIFLEPDLKTLVIRLTGEFHWEMCKRVQGIHWNDVTTPSLTSEYSDYLQFYKNNHDLAMETKETIRQGLASAKNNYRSMFVSNYTEWLLYESNGLPRLNKVALRILAMYCPFTTPIREKLLQNPRYASFFSRFNIKQQQRVQLLTRIIQKVEKGGKPAPQELLDELQFLQS